MAFAPFTTTNLIAVLYLGFPIVIFLDVVNPNDFPDLELPTWEDEPVQIELCLDIKCVRKL